ncbi:LamG domain-containing protein [Methylomonas rapida]|uniref:LamG domain-containing protein n=1 Tax=Methylomonas rapida TaxID=2963939 RepID=A0ABY7GFE3_9GAMM|nr:LamG domain-containing protein [Methylomonas rapida]WAR42944.1 LamG domain-containing protein [Methylomonas rapida]
MAGDPYWYDNVKLLLPMIGANNSTTFTDLERVPKVVTPYGNAKIITSQADPFGNNTGVGSFNGNGDYLQLVALGLKNRNFTVDAWIKPLSTHIGVVISAYNKTGYQANTTYIVFYNNVVSLGNGLVGVDSPTLPLGQWSLISYTYNHAQQKTTGFLTGQNFGSVVGAITNEALSFFVGGSPGDNNWGTWWFNGYISNVRITLDVIRYTANFTPPTAPFPDYNTQISGTVDETLAASTFVAEAHQASDGALSGRKVFTGASFTVDIKTPEKAHYLTVKPDVGAAWKASTAYALNGKTFPTDPITKPYYYTATVAGTSGTTEPNWPTTPGQTVTDGTVTWECVERLVQPITHGPLIPS